MTSISRDAQQALDWHNETRRAAPGACPDLVWSKSVEAAAEQYARKLLKNNRGLVHDPALPKLRNGENLAQQTGGYLSLAESTRLWLEEKRYYHGEPLSPTGADGYGNVYGHYTQAISSHATKVGIACAKAGIETYVVARYDTSQQKDERFWYTDQQAQPIKRTQPKLQHKHIVTSSHSKAVKRAEKKSIMDSMISSLFGSSSSKDTSHRRKSK